MPETNTNKWVGWLVLILLVIGGFYYFSNKDESVNDVDNTVATTTPNNSNGTTGGTTGGAVKPDGLFGYANAEHNFTMRFPPTIQTRNDFSTFYQLASNWRLNAGQANQGKPVVSFPIFRIDQGTVATGKNYPLYYTAEVRVGVSNNVNECYTVDAGYSQPTNVTINGVAFKKFNYQEAAMMKYITGASYRTIRNNKCYVLEQVKAGSTYRDDTMKPGVTDATLDAYYKSGETIIKTFKFTK
jgi:hypothetical protein